MEGKFVAAVLAVLLVTTAGMMGSASADKFTQCYDACMTECGHNGSFEVCATLCVDRCRKQGGGRRLLWSTTAQGSIDGGDSKQ
ncbi:unnamed protein product [Linum trigynum]|uniref:Uncharacterized protein n=1 Tax=Linum trigynum TaxID=586398 RepID=A0AAV2FZS5_9ROSI